MRSIPSTTAKAGDEELFRSRAREKGEVKIIELISARLDAKTDSYLATLPGLRLSDARITPDLVKEHERMLTGGFYAEITLSYDAAIAQEKNGRPFGVDSLRQIQLSKLDVLDRLAEARKEFTTEEWKLFLLRSVGIEAEGLSERARDAFMLRMAPFVERNYNMVELGPRGTGKSHLFQQVSPYAHLVSGGKTTVAKLFVENTAKGRRGLVCQYDVVCFDEISGISFDQKDGVNIMKGYMESGEFSRGKESIRPNGQVKINDKEITKYLLKINQNHSVPVQFATLTHELGHLFLGHTGPDKAMNVPKRIPLKHGQRELEAESVSFLVCARNGVQSKAESYLANFVKENTSTDSIDLYQIMRAAGQVETILELTSHTSYAPGKRAPRQGGPRSATAGH